MPRSLTKKQQRFIERYSQLWKASIASGINDPRVGAKAARQAGYGFKSPTLVHRQLAAERAFNRLIKKPLVLETLKKQGVEL